MDHGGRSAPWRRKKSRASSRSPSTFKCGKYCCCSIRSTARRTSTSTCRSARSSPSCRKITRGRHGELEDMLQPGRRQVAAGYVIYGSSTMLVYTTGQGVHGFTLDPSIGEFLLSHPNITHSRRRPVSLGQRFVRAAVGRQRARAHAAATAASTATASALSTRYVGSLVADFHRNLLGGGIFAYPANTKSPQRQAAPAVRGESARVHRRAGGRRGDRRHASAILDVQPTELHQRTPLYIGSKTSRLVEQTSRRRSIGASHLAREASRRDRVRTMAAIPAASRSTTRRHVLALRLPDRRRSTGPTTRALDYARDLGDPGQFPFTRGVQPTMYRGRLWTMRQYAGFGTAAETNQRFRYLLDAGQTGLSVAFDLPTQMGIDSDSPRALGEVGRVGVAIDTVEDMHVLLDGIPLDKVSTSMTINATASTLLAMYIVVAEERGHRARASSAARSRTTSSRSTSRAARTSIRPSRASRSITDMFRFCAARGAALESDLDLRLSHPRGRRDGGAGARVHARQRDRVRAARASTPGSPSTRSRRGCRSSSPRTTTCSRRSRSSAPRGACRRGSCASGSARATRAAGCASTRRPAASRSRRSSRSTTSCASPCRRWPRCSAARSRCTRTATTRRSALPTAEAATLALRTQQIIALRVGRRAAPSIRSPAATTSSISPNELERRAIELLAQVDELGGAAQGDRGGVLPGGDRAQRVRASAARRARRDGDRRRQQVRRRRARRRSIPTPDYSALEREQVERVRGVRARARRRRASTRRSPRCATRRAAYADARPLRATAPLMPLIIDAVRARATRRRDRRRAARVRGADAIGPLERALPLNALSRVDDFTAVTDLAPSKS